MSSRERSGPASALPADESVTLGQGSVSEVAEAKPPPPGLYDDDDDDFDLLEDDEDEDKARIGRMAGNYRILRRLGRGGTGSVFEAIHPVIETRVAVKFLNKSACRQPELVERFFNEARAVNRIGHDNVVKILDMNSTDDKRYYIVMEFLDGRPLRALMKGTPLPLRTAGPILLQVCDAIGVAHDRGIVHRDLKPDNIYLTTHNRRDLYVKVLDFGIAKLSNDASREQRTRTGTVMGTPSYMSPEQASGKHGILDGRSDIYALGIITYQMFAGRVPFKSDSFAETLVKHIIEPPPPPSQFAEVPPPLERLILKALAKDPGARHQTAAEFAGELLGIMTEAGVPYELPLVANAGDVPARPAVPPLPVAPAETTPKPADARAPSPGPAKAEPTPPPQAPPERTAKAPDAAPPAGGAETKAAEETREPTKPPEPSPDASARQRPRRLAGAFLAAAALAGVGYVLLRGDGGPGTTAAQVATMPLNVASTPPGAALKASEPGGWSATARTPAVLQVPAGKTVSLELALDGFAPAQRSVTLDQPRTVEVTLEKAPLEKAPPKAEKPPPDRDGTVEVRF